MYLAPFRNRANRAPTHIFPKELTAAHDFLGRIERGLPELGHMSALILWGDSDFAFKEHERQRFRTLFASHRDITLRNAGHFIQEDAPGQICDAILDWYASPDAPPRRPCAG